MSLLDKMRARRRVLAERKAWLDRRIEADAAMGRASGFQRAESAALGWALELADAAIGGREAGNYARDLERLINDAKGG